MNPTQKILNSLKKNHGVVGRELQLENLIHCLLVHRHVLLEGPVGVGKTFLVSAIAKTMDKGVIRVDGDSRYSEQKLTGWFDPPTVLKRGYTAESFMEGPLTKAMRQGAVLFINELNRMPEGVQNILLPALDEGHIELPKIGTVVAAAGFSVVATQNPKEFVATSHISEALLDQFELITLTYQEEEEERQILETATNFQKKENIALLEWCLQLMRGTRNSPLFKRGASIRAGLSLYDLSESLGGDWDAFMRASEMALPTRVELSDEGQEKGFIPSINSLLENLKKKSPRKP